MKIDFSTVNLNPFKLLANLFSALDNLIRQLAKKLLPRLPCLKERSDQTTPETTQKSLAHEHFVTVSTPSTSPRTTQKSLEGANSVLGFLSVPTPSTSPETPNYLSSPELG